MATPRANSNRSLHDAAVAIVQRLRDGGQVAYFAGGSVRDALLGVEPTDYDVATDAHPDRVKELFPGWRYVGESFGVVLVKLAGHFVEVATFRTEWGYEDGRHPGEVHFTDAEHDAARRDFTINGLFYDPLEDRIIDYVGGEADLKAQILRAIGEPDERFGEDFLRMLRGVRFAARLGFAMDDATAAAIRRHAPSLSRISRERIGQELRLMFAGPRPASAVRLLQRLQLDAPALTEAHLDVPAGTVSNLRGEVHFATGLAAWMLDRHVPDGASPPAGVDAVRAFVLGDEVKPHQRRWRAALCLSNEESDELRLLLGYLPEAFAWDDLPVARRKRLLARAQWEQLLRLLRGMRQRYGLAGLVERIEAEAKPLFAEGVAPPPLVNGDDLVMMGRKPGPMFGRLLEQAYDRQLEGGFAGREAALAWLAEQAETGD